VKRLERSRTDRLLFGVCGGFGEYFGVDADLVRVLWIVTVLLGGIGVLPYVAAILLLPEGSGEASPRSSSAGRYVGFALIALAILFFFRLLQVPGLGVGVISLWGWKLLLPAVLFVGGALLVWPALRGMFGLPSGRPIRRSVTNRVLAGVAGGFAEATGTDANLVRIAFVLAATLTSGLAILVYLVLIPVLREEEVGPVSTAPAGPPPGEVPPAPAPASPPAAADPAPEPSPASPPAPDETGDAGPDQESPSSGR
jgi:phage shock protein C